jgi:hypothetical protein
VIDIGAAPASVELLLPRAATIQLRLAADATPPPEGLRVRLVDEGLGTREAGSLLGFSAERSLLLTFAGGELLDVGPGRHRLVASDPKIEIVPATIAVASAPGQSFELRWRRREH